MCELDLCPDVTLTDGIFQADNFTDDIFPDDNFPDDNFLDDNFPAENFQDDNFPDLLMLWNNVQPNIGYRVIMQVILATH